MKTKIEYCIGVHYSHSQVFGFGNTALRAWMVWYIRCCVRTMESLSSSPPSPPSLYCPSGKAGAGGVSRGRLEDAESLTDLGADHVCIAQQSNSNWGRRSRGRHLPDCVDAPCADERSGDDEGETKHCANCALVDENKRRIGESGSTKG